MSLLYTLSTRFLTVPMQQQIHITETTHAVVNAPFLLKESLQIKHETPQKKMLPMYVKKQNRQLFRTATTCFVGKFATIPATIALPSAVIAAITIVLPYPIICPIPTHANACTKIKICSNQNNILVSDKRKRHARSIIGKKIKHIPSKLSSNMAGANIAIGSP